ncbi:MAG: hypothetical protein AB7N76_34380 [Planctomycetota bacterium]
MRATGRGTTLLEVAVATGLAGLVAALAAELLLGAQRQAGAAAAREQAVGESSRVAHLLARELRGLNHCDVDLESDAPFQSTTLSYRVVQGYDPATELPQLDPPRASAGFRVLSLQGDAVVLARPGAPDTDLARGVSDLRFTLAAPHKLTIEVAARAKDDTGATVERRVALTIALQNTQSQAE